MYSALDKIVPSLPNKALPDQYIKELLKAGVKPQEIIDRRLGELIGAPIQQKIRTVIPKGKEPIQEKYFDVMPSAKGTKSISREEIENAAKKNRAPDVSTRVLKGERSREDQYSMEYDDDSGRWVVSDQWGMPKKSFDDDQDAEFYLAKINGGEAQYEDPEYMVPGGEKYREILFKVPTGYRSPHFGEEGKDYLAHARVTDRTDATGKKVLHVEEIQSDLHQKGRKSGYKKTDLDKQIDALQGQRDIEQSLPNRMRLTEKIQELEGMRDRGVPDAPFKNNWHELVLKHLLDEAVKKGYDKLFITPGDEQVNRYELEGKEAEGKRKIYDEIIPNFLNRYGKKWGAKVGRDVIHKPDYDIVKGNVEKAYGEGSPAYNQALKNMSVPVHSFEITPQMKEAIKVSGQKLYKSGGSVPSQAVMRLAIGGQGPRNWLKGSIEKVLEPLMPRGPAHRDEALMLGGQWTEDADTPEGQKQISHNEAIGNWVQSNLANYIRKQMGSPKDPVRDLAEHGILHFDPHTVPIIEGHETPHEHAESRREMLGGQKMSKGALAQAWEDAVDSRFDLHSIKDMMSIPEMYGNQIESWMLKANPKTDVWEPYAFDKLGFDHIVDILKQDLREGRIRPEQLNKVSMADAVRRVHKYDLERKKAMAETALKATEGMPIHKDYGDGFKWIELALPESRDTVKGHPKSGKAAYKQLQEALKYEGDTMGHCVGNYCPDVAEGRSRIFSLRDAKNEPHVTIEVRPGMPPKEQAAKGMREIGGHLNKILQIKGKANAKPKKDYIPYVQDFVKSGNWSQINDSQNAGLRRYNDVFNDNEQRAIERTGEPVPDHEYLTGDQIQRLHNAIYAEGQRLKYDAEGNIVGDEKRPKQYAVGGNVQGGFMPTLSEMKLALANRNNPMDLKSIGVNEALGYTPKPYIPPDHGNSFQPAPGGVAMKSGIPIGGVDLSKMQPGQQLMPSGVLPQGNMPGQQPNPMPTGMGDQSLPADQSNILSLTPQGQALSALKPQQPQAMARGGKVKSPGITMGSPKITRLVFQAQGPGGVTGINVPRHMWEGSAKNAGMKEINAMRAKVYGGENRDPLTIGQIGRIHKDTLAEHFSKPLDEQVKAEKEALGRLRKAGHISKDSNTLDVSEKLDTVRHEYDDEGRAHVGYAAKGVAGHALYTSGHGKNMKHRVVNTCPGQTEGCGGGKDAKGIVDTTKGTCFAPVAESQYPGASIRRACHEQAKHDPAMTRDWILAHTGSMRDAAKTADKNDERLLFRPNVVDETDTSSRHVIRHLNDQRKEEDKPEIIANSYGKTNELHDPENGYYVTHSNVGPKVKKGKQISENIGRDKARVRNTVMAADNRGDFRNEQGNLTPPKGSYMVTDVKRNSPMSKLMEEHITHAKYWTTGREEHELIPEEKEEGSEGHFDGNGKSTTPEKAHYGHTTINGRRYDYQKQHILHPRLVQVGENKDGTPHMIPTDSRFKDTDFLPKKRFKTKNGKEAGHILMTTPTESTSNLGHETAFTHHVGEENIKHAMSNKGEYEIDKPEDQEAARGKEYVAPKEIKISKMVKMASGGSVGSRHPGLSDDDFHAFPERNYAAQRHLAMRMDPEERDANYAIKHGRKKVIVHKNTDTMRYEMTMRRKG